MSDLILIWSIKGHTAVGPPRFTQRATPGHPRWRNLAQNLLQGPALPPLHASEEDLLILEDRNWSGNRLLHIFTYLIVAMYIKNYDFM